MNQNRLSILLALSLLAAVNSLATVRYVDANSTNPTPPYTSWATAAANIQDAVDAAGPGDQILVTNGVYASGGKVVFYTLSNRVYAATQLAIQSVNGPQFTFIQGQQVPGTTNGEGAVRCVYLSSGASLSGFTLTQGATRVTGDQVYEQSGGGILNQSGVVSNCVIIGNAASYRGGGAYSGGYQGCRFANNWASEGGGVFNGVLSNCELSGNSAGNGGGVSGSTLTNCTVIGNTATNQYGGGADASTLTGCLVASNSITGNGSGGGVSQSTVRNCALQGNSATAFGGGAFEGTLNNCTITGNSARSGGGVAAVSPQYGSCMLTNCIVYYNQARQFGDNFDLSATLNFCCTTPLPSSGVGNLTAEPQLAAAWRLSAGSPCRGAGLAASTAGLDLDGEAWASPPAIGCDEYHSGSITGAITVAMVASYTNIATGFAVEFQEHISGRVNASRWDFGDGTVVSNRPSLSHSWNAPGSYPVVLRAYNESFPAGVASTVTVQVVSVPVHFVSLTSPASSPPYSSWATAATNIQDAVDGASLPGALVLVSNGVYETGISVVSGGSNRVAVTKPLRVESVNGPSVTTIVGSGVSSPQRVRCAYLTGGAMLAGFTVTNGVTPTGASLTERQEYGGGIYCEWPSAVVSNCVLTGNQAYSGGGAAGGTLDHCTVSSNAVGFYESGGGAFGSRLHNCTLMGNKASWGGGASECVLDDCLLMGNKGQDYILVYGFLPFAGYGGGVDSSTLDRCRLVGNSAAGGGGAANSRLNNCTLLGNVATGGVGVYYNGASGGGGALRSLLFGCTVVSNSSASDGSTPGGGGANDSTLKNCILYYNTGLQDSNYATDSQQSMSLDFCCTTPMPTNGLGNITNAPLFVDQAAGNLRLQPNSPCINAGNNSFVLTVSDLDGLSRIQGGTVDMGAYEFQSPSSVLSYAWAQRYGLSTDGSADYSDADNDRMNNWQEWIAGTVPTDATSALRLLSPSPSPSGAVVTWESVSNRTYFLERTTNIGGTPFSLVASNILGQAGTTSFTDTNATGAGPFFYRVGVQ